MASEMTLPKTLVAALEEIDRLTGWLQAIRQLPLDSPIETAIAMAGTAYQTRQVALASGGTITETQAPKIGER
jgi:hypothetical protein